MNRRQTLLSWSWNYTKLYECAERIILAPVFNNLAIGNNGHAPIADTLGVILTAALRAALTQALAGHPEAREALKALL